MMNSNHSKKMEKIGDFQLLEQLGEGGMGIIYRARNDADGKHVALKMVKIPHESLLQGIRREIYSLTRISHPGIVSIVDHGLHAGTPWYAMELLDGVTLDFWQNGKTNTTGDMIAKTLTKREIWRAVIATVGLTASMRLREMKPVH